MGFPTGRDSATFWDKGTEVPLLTKRKQDKLRILTGRDRTSFTVYNALFLFFNVLLLFFGVFFGTLLWPGTSWDRGVCPGIFAPALVPGQRDTRTRKFLCPGTKGQQDVPFRFVPGCPMETLIWYNESDDIMKTRGHPAYVYEYLIKENISTNCVVN